MVDSFFKKTKKRVLPSEAAQTNAKRARPVPEEDITSESEQSEAESVEESESEDETEADKRRRLAKDYINTVKQELQGDHDFDAQDLDNDIIASRLQLDAAENEGKIFRRWGQSELKMGPLRKFRSKAKHLVCLASVWPHAYAAAKDLTLEKYKLSTNEAPKLVHTVKAGTFKNKKFAKLGPTDPKKTAYAGHFGEILCIAVSHDNKYVVTGGRDHRIIVWSAENLSPIKVFDTQDRRGEVYSLTFRDKTLQLYAGCGDLKVRTYDLEQMAHVEVLYGHQDKVVGISALRQEKCVSVGARDRSAIVWKIPEESRLTLRGGDTKLAAQSGNKKEPVLEGSIDCCAMLDNQFFVTGSDNGNLSLWSSQRKKPVFIVPHAHGLLDPLTPTQASAETNPELVEIPPPQPREISSLVALPFSDLLFTGSYCGSIKCWRLSEDFRSLELVREIKAAKGIVTGLAVSEKAKGEIVVSASIGREPRLGRWLTVSGHDVVASFNINVNA